MGRQKYTHVLPHGDSQHKEEIGTILTSNLIHATFSQLRWSYRSRIRSTKQQHQETSRTPLYHEDARQPVTLAVCSNQKATAFGAVTHIETNASDLCGVHFEGFQQSLALACKLCRGICEARQCYAAAHVVTVPMPHELGGVRGVCLAAFQLEADGAPLHTSSCTHAHTHWMNSSTTGTTTNPCTSHDNSSDQGNYNIGHSDIDGDDDSNSECDCNSHVNS